MRQEDVHRALHLHAPRALDEDAVARLCYREGRKLPAADRAELPALAELLKRADADRLLRLALGATVYDDLRVRDVTELWARANAARDRDAVSAKNWRAFLPWVPGQLFASINLPQLRVHYQTDAGQERSVAVDVSLAFGLCAPGNATRRFGFHAVAAVVGWDSRRWRCAAAGPARPRHPRG